jgi:hypothetical protein
MRSGFRATIMLQIIGIERVHGLDEAHPNHEQFRRGAAYNMRPPVRSKKMGNFELHSPNALAGHCNRKMVRIEGYAEAIDPKPSL